MIVVPQHWQTSLLTTGGPVVSPSVGTPGGIDSVAYTLLTTKLPNGQYLFPSANPNSLPTVNFPENVFLTQPAYFISDQAVTDLDYLPTPKDTLSLKYYYQHDPTTAHRSGSPLSKVSLNTSMLAARSFPLRIRNRSNQTSVLRRFSASFAKKFTARSLSLSLPDRSASMRLAQTFFPASPSSTIWATTLRQTQAIAHRIRTRLPAVHLSTPA
jgi:hypothetical protein